jgi:hypothetical protein
MALGLEHGDPIEAMLDHIANGPTIDGCTGI